MDLMGGEAWERRHELAFSLWLERAESEYLNGSFDEAGNLIAELLERANSKLEKVAAYRLRTALSWKITMDSSGQQPTMAPEQPSNSLSSIEYSRSPGKHRSTIRTEHRLEAYADATGFQPQPLRGREVKE
jgi:hypothetical protein